MAKLSHPHVLAEHDVGTTPDAGVFIAMKLVEGQNLRDYLKAHPGLSVRDRVRLFLGAGEGLAAAHASGLVHRDFKPDNVLVDGTGWVRVMDFGLALLSSAPLPETPAPAPSSEMPSHTPRAGLLLSAIKTSSGLVKGTPAYLAPEQLLGEKPTAKVDQFAFCVSLYEALYGTRPFLGFPNLRPPETRWRVEDAPAGARVPAWLRRVLLRGLSESPDARYPSLPALSKVLREDPTARRKRLALGALGVVALVALGGFLKHQADARDLICKGSTRRLAGVWDGPEEKRLQAVFAARASEASQSAWVNAKAGLDRFTQSWVTMRTEACEATRRRGEQTEEIFTLRMSCLDRRLEELQVLTEALGTTVEEARLLKAPEAVNALSPLSGCADVAALRSEVPLPNNPADRRRMEQGEQTLLRAKVLISSGKDELADGLAHTVLADAREHHLDALSAQALLMVGVTTLARGDESASTVLWEAALANVATHQDTLALEAANRLANSYLRIHDVTGADRALQVAGALVQRAPPMS